LTHAACHSEPEFTRPKTLARPAKLPRAARLLATLLFSTATVLAATVTGTITNGTTGKPSAGDTIAVVNMARSMDEIAHATSDATGTFHVDVPDDGQILLHVTHREADYFKTIAPGTHSADIEVFDSAARVPGILGEALVQRIETDPSGRTLTVSEDFFVKNSSAPPRTEFGAHTFDFYLPTGAQITQSLASAHGGLPTTAKLATIDAATGHFAFTFPIRPGETQFQVNYTLPYNGRQACSLKLSIPTGDVIVILPKTTQFTSSAQFQPISADPSSQSYDLHQPDFAQPIAFIVSGSGQLPQITSTPQSVSPAAADQSTPAAAPSQTAATDTRPGGGLGIPDDPGGTNDPWSRYKWWILGGLGLALACGAGIMLRSGPTSSAAVAPPPQPTSDITAPAGMYHPAPAPSTTSAPPSTNALLEALKDELFELEKDRLAGSLTDAEYAEHKAALDLVLRRALARTRTA
jgi:hypothetical protein